jgi:hypothetical protein
MFSDHGNGFALISEFLFAAGTVRSPDADPISYSSHLIIFFFVGHSFAYVARFVFLRDVWIRTQRAAVAYATNLATHLPSHNLTSLPAATFRGNILTSHFHSILI